MAVSVLVGYFVQGNVTYWSKFQDDVHNLFQSLFPGSKFGLISKMSNFGQHRCNRDHSFSTYAEILEKTKNSYPLVCTRTLAYQGVRNPENFAYVIN